MTPPFFSVIVSAKHSTPSASIAGSTRKNMEPPRNAQKQINILSLLRRQQGSGFGWR